MEQSEEKNLTQTRVRRNLTKALAIGGAAALSQLAPRKAQAVVPCFLKGTQILTPDGYRAIETLKNNDLVQSKFGGAQPIKWIFQTSYKKSNPAKSWVNDVKPVRIAKSAIRENVPSSDLHVSPQHAIFIDGTLFPTEFLVIDVTIARDDEVARDEIEYFHILLENHDVVVANGLECETLRRMKENASNFADYLPLHGDAETLPLCAPRFEYAGGRAKIKSHLLSAISQIVDLRRDGDVIRDRLEERAFSSL